MPVVAFAPRRRRLRGAVILALAALAAAGAVAARRHRHRDHVVQPPWITGVRPLPPPPPPPVPLLLPLPPAPAPTIAATFVPSAIRRPYCGNQALEVVALFRPWGWDRDMRVLVPCSAVDGVVYDGPAPGPIVLAPGRSYVLTISPITDAVDGKNDWLWRATRIEEITEVYR
jgi:hypothetical protein